MRCPEEQPKWLGLWNSETLAVFPWPDPAAHPRLWGLAAPNVVSRTSKCSKTVRPLVPLRSMWVLSTLAAGLLSWGICLPTLRLCHNFSPLCCGNRCCQLELSWLVMANANRGCCFPYLTMAFQFTVRSYTDFPWCDTGSFVEKPLMTWVW